jgi:sortase A
MNPATDQERFALRGRRFIRWTRGLMLVGGGLAVCYVALTLLNGRLYQDAANKSLDRQANATEQPVSSLSRATKNEGDVLGRIEIPRLGLKVAILEGTSAQTLRLGAGHIKGTALPGEPGNIGIAGHRDTWFRAVRDIRDQDEIQIQTRSGLSRYEVDWMQIVEPGDGGVLTASPGSAVTLVTCFPFHYIGAAPERYIVHARLAPPK